MKVNMNKRAKTIMICKVLDVRETESKLDVICKTKKGERFIISNSERERPLWYFLQVLTKGDIIKICMNFSDKFEFIIPIDKIRYIKMIME